MSNVNNISEELKQIAPAVANLTKNNPYIVPMGYFDRLPEDILNHVVEPSFLSEIDFSKQKKQTYQLPNNYFDGLAASILSKIHDVNTQKDNEVSKELRELAPLLNEINKGNVLWFPQDYFKTFSVDITNEKKEAKVVSLGTTASIRKWITYAAAASVLFILSTASYFYVNHHLKNSAKSLSVEQRLATLKDEEIINYLKNDVGDFDPNTATSTEEDPDINHLLINASDAEIERYLDTEGDSGEEIIKGI